MARAPPPATASLRATLTTAKPAYFIGEDVVVTYCVENTSATKFDARAMPDYGLRPVVTNAGGVVMPQPMFLLGSGLVQRGARIEPSGRWCRSFSLMQFVRIEQSDDYTVRASIEFLSGSQLTPSSGHEVQTRVTLRMPTEAEVASDTQEGYYGSSDEIERRTSLSNPNKGVPMKAGERCAVLLVLFLGALGAQFAFRGPSVAIAGVPECNDFIDWVEKVSESKYMDWHNAADTNPGENWFSEPVPDRKGNPHPQMASGHILWGGPASNEHKPCSE